MIKLSDYGWATLYKHNEKLYKFCGTLDYMAPEMICRYDYNSKIDVWAIGVLIYELLTGNAPFESKNENETMAKIIGTKLEFVNDEVSIEVQELIKGILKKEEDERMQLKDILSNSWIQKNDSFYNYWNQSLLFKCKDILF